MTTTLLNNNIYRNQIYYGNESNKKSNNRSIRNTVVKTTALGTAGAVTGLLLTKNKILEEYGGHECEGRRGMKVAVKMKKIDPGHPWGNAILGALIFIAGGYAIERAYKYFKKDSEKPQNPAE